MHLYTGFIWIKRINAWVDNGKVKVLALAIPPCPFTTLQWDSNPIPHRTAAISRIFATICANSSSRLSFSNGPRSVGGLVRQFLVPNHRVRWRIRAVAAIPWHWALSARAHSAPMAAANRRKTLATRRQRGTRAICTRTNAWIENWPPHRGNWTDTCTGNGLRAKLLWPVRRAVCPLAISMLDFLCIGHRRYRAFRATAAPTSHVRTMFVSHEKMPSFSWPTMATHTMRHWLIADADPIALNQLDTVKSRVHLPRSSTPDTWCRNIHWLH